MVENDTYMDALLLVIELGSQIPGFAVAKLLMHLSVLSQLKIYMRAWSFSINSVEYFWLYKVNEFFANVIFLCLKSSENQVS